MNVTVSSAPAVPSQVQQPQEPVQHHPAPEDAADAAATAGPADRVPLFRLHTAAHEAPSSARVFVLASWAAICIFIGLIPAGRLVAAFIVKTSFFQGYPLSAAFLGMLGLLLITAAFASIHRARLPWALMTIATSLLMVNVAMVYLIPV